jgi:hypothetical protein
MRKPTLVAGSRSALGRLKAFGKRIPQVVFNCLGCHRRHHGVSLLNPIAPSLRVVIGTKEMLAAANHRLIADLPGESHPRIEIVGIGFKLKRALQDCIVVLQSVRRSSVVAFARPAFA